MCQDLVRFAKKAMTSRHRPRISLEFFPPRGEEASQRLLTTAAALQAVRPEFVSVTFGAGGSTRDRSFATTREILRTTQLEVAPHLSCIHATRDEVRSILALYETAGVRRIVALRGDPPEGDEKATRDFQYANELVEFIRSEFSSFRLSVACYPEFHPEAPSADADMANFARKVRAGADEAITQYFYSNDAYYRFVESVAKLGVDIPIVPGLMPMTNYAQVKRFSEFCGADIPQWLAKRMQQHADDPSAQEELGIEMATRQAEDLLRQGVPGLHFYTLNKAAPTLRIASALGLVADTPPAHSEPRPTDRL